MTHILKFYKNTKNNTNQFLICLEGVWIASMILAFWHISPPIRDQYVFLLLFAIPIYTLRYIIHRRFFTHTPLDILFLIFAIVTIYNFNNAPLARADYWVIVCRPFLGIFIVWYFVEHVRHYQHMRYLIVVTIILASVIGLVALLASQWTISSKSDDFRFILDILPRLDHKAVLPDMQLSFNPNEIAGALAYCCPFLLAIGLGSFRTQTSATSRCEFVINWLERWGALIGFTIAFTALFLGQSRFALAGTFIGLFIVIITILPTWKFRTIGIGIWSLIVFIEILLVLNILPLNLAQSSESNTSEPTVGLNQRDESSFTNRFALWDRAIQMTMDYPTTGAGMSVYRAMVTREDYIIASYANRGARPPHAHNALLQMGADLGVIGWALFIGWYGVVAGMAIYTIQNGNLKFTIMTITVTASILGYMGYGIGDTITLWDRFAFIHWWYIGLMTATYISAKRITNNKLSNV